MLTPWKVGIAVVAAGSVFVLLHGIHKWNPEHCRICELMT